MQLCGPSQEEDTPGRGAFCNPRASYSPNDAVELKAHKSWVVISMLAKRTQTGVRAGPSLLRA
jgi:hypothetical protein